MEPPEGGAPSWNLTPKIQRNQQFCDLRDRFSSIVSYNFLPGAIQGQGMLFTILIGMGA